MASSGRANPRAVLLLLVVLLAVAEVHGLALLLHSQEQARVRWAGDARQRIGAIRPQLEATLRRDGPAAMVAEARRLLAPTTGAVLLGYGGQVLARDLPPDVDAGAPAAPQLNRLRSGEIVIVGPTGGSSPRVTLYSEITLSGRVAYLGVVRAAEGLARDLAERRTTLFVHGLCLVLAAFVALTAALVGRTEAETVSGARAMGAYEEAMARLRQRGDEVSLVQAEELRHLRETVRDREAMARAGELTAGIVHEMRNGLGTIMGYARLIEGGVPPTSQSAERVRGLIEEARTLEGVIQRIVEFVRNEELRPSEFDLRRMLERVVGRETRSRAGAAASVEMGAPVPIVADEDLLERAFENLIRNGRDAAGADGSVHVQVGREGDVVVVRIADDGPGLPPELVNGPKAFVTTKRGGLGLGLPMALKILTLHEARLALRPGRPKGLVAEVVLPVPAPSPSLPSVATDAGDRAGTAPGSPS